jgi:hypothetical protein
VIAVACGVGCGLRSRRVLLCSRLESATSHRPLGLEGVGWRCDAAASGSWIAGDAETAGRRSQVAAAGRLGAGVFADTAAGVPTVAALLHASSTVPRREGMRARIPSIVTPPVGCARAIFCMSSARINHLRLAAHRQKKSVPEILLSGHALGTSHGRVTKVATDCYCCTDRNSITW